MEKSVVEKIFDSVHKSYDSFLNLTTFGLINKWQNQLISATDLKRYVLDIGTGTGEIVRKLRGKDKECFIYAVDLSFNMLKTAKNKVSDEKILYIRANALKLPFKNSSLDNIFFSLVFRHLPREEITKELRRVLRQYGTVSILEIGKPESDIFYKFIHFFADRLFRPIGRLIFSKEEWDYFVESIENAMKISEIKPFFNKHGFNVKFLEKRFFGLIHLIVLEKIE